MHFVLDRNKDHIPPDCTSILLTDASKFIFLCTFLQSNTTVKAVNFQCESFPLEMEQAKMIAEALKVNCTVTRLCLSNNLIGEEGTGAIAEAFKVNKTITHLNLWRNQIRAEGAKAIAEALKVNRTVKKLHLGGNRIGDEGAKALAGALKVNSTITKLVLSDNNIGDKGAKALAEALKVNFIVKTVVFDNKIEDARFCNQIDDERLLDEIDKATRINISIADNLKPIVMDEKCKTMALGLLPKVPIYVLLDILELVVILDLEQKTNCYKFYNNHLFLKFLESKVSKKRLLRIMDKIDKK